MIPVRDVAGCVCVTVSTAHLRITRLSGLRFSSRFPARKAALRTILMKRPHLADPIRFYEREAAFIDAAGRLPLAVTPAQKAYAPELLEEIFNTFSSFLELPAGTLSPLKQAMEVREIDFTRLPLGEVPAFSLPYAEDDLAMLLFLLAKPWFLAMRQAFRIEDWNWREGRCPVCNSRPVVTWIGEDDRRQVLCLFCNTRGYVARSGCPVCLAANSEHQNVLLFEGEEGFAVTACDLCRSYVKTVYPGIIAHWSPEIADLMSLPIDVLVQKKGYARRAPNPIGMRKITATG
jgi:FdhE protein